MSPDDGDGPTGMTSSSTTEGTPESTTECATGSTVTSTVGSGDATVTYDVHGDLSLATGERPVLMVVASPMEAAAFTTLRSHFTDRMP